MTVGIIPTTRDKARTEEQHLLRKVVAGRQAWEQAALLQLLELRLTRAKACLVECLPSELGKFQGEAQAYNKLFQDIEKAALLVEQEERNHGH